MAYSSSKLINTNRCFKQKIDKQVFYERLKTYHNALKKFESALTLPHDEDKAYLDAAAHRFMYCFELTWKSLRRMLRMRDIQANSPVSAFRGAYAEGWIENKALYEKMLDDRNTVTHEYFEEKAVEIYSRLPQYLAEMQNLSTKLKEIYINEPDGI